MKVLKRLICVFLVTLLAVTGMASAMALQEDTRTEVATIVATSDMAVPAYGAAAPQYYNFTLSMGLPAGISQVMGNWLVKRNGNWYRYDSAVFNEGTYCYSTQIRVDNDAGTTHKLASAVDITIDGVKWTQSTSTYVGSNYSYCYMDSPEYVVVRDPNFPLSFEDSSIYDVDGELYVNKAITSYSFSTGVLGGTGNYTFSKTSGPAWLTVSADGVLSGTPNATAESTTAVIRVTDEAETYKEITIKIAQVYPDPALRQTVDTVVGTSNIGTPAFGAQVFSGYDFVLTVGLPAYASQVMGYWEIKNGDNWIRYDGNVFIVGTYRYSTQLRIDQDGGRTHKLATAVDIVIDGESWTHNEPWIDSSYSYLYMVSPEFVVEEPPVEELFFLYDESMNVPDSYQNHAISPISVAGGVVGGKAPYTFSKTSGPAWLNVSEDGTLAGTPTVVTGVSEAIIRVTDSRGIYKEIAISVGGVRMDPALRSVVESVVATSNLIRPTYKGAVTVLGTFVVEASAARFAADSQRGWYVKNGDEWVKYTAEIFGEGEYRYQNQICVDGSYGYTWRLGNTISVTVDGVAWTSDASVIELDKSYTTVYSPVYTVKKPSNPFVDVKESDYYYDAVLWALSEEVTSGLDATHFGPNANCSRAQAVSFLWRLAGSPAPQTSQNPFNDVKQSDYYYSAVLWATEHNITAGTTKNTFSPNDPCTRGQIVTFLWRAAGEKKENVLNPFNDVKKNDYYYDAVLWAVKNNITAGMTPEKFSPADKCTRGQIVTFLYRTQG